MTLPNFNEVDEFAHSVLSHVDREIPFSPQVHTSEDGDCIEFIISDDDYYAERIDSFVTVYYSRQSKKIIGSIIKGLKQFMREVMNKTPGFKIEIQNGKLKLDRLFTVHLWVVGDSSAKDVLTYERLRDLARTENIEADLCMSS